VKVTLQGGNLSVAMTRRKGQHGAVVIDIDSSLNVHASGFVAMSLLAADVQPTRPGDVTSPEQKAPASSAYMKSSL
jgi:hypothetical protein